MAGLSQPDKVPARDSLSWEDLGLPDKVQPLRHPAPYKVLYGGRGGSRSWSFARIGLYRAMQKPIRILCAREYQTSIKESVHHLLRKQIEMLGLEWQFKITDRSITGVNGSEFIFKGLKNDPRSIKSTEGINICWVEEAENISKTSWDILLPTIREEGSELWVCFNPKKKTDPTYKILITDGLPGEVAIKVNWKDNPYFPEKLRKLMEHCRATDMDTYRHIWEGECQEHSAAEIFRGKWSVTYFEPQHHWHGPYWGSDLGFAEDPVTLVRAWIADDGIYQDLYVEELVYEVGLDLDKMPESFQSAGQFVIHMDNSRPETISYLKRKGLNTFPCVKGPNSVEEGIRFLRSFRHIFIHSDSRNFRDEAENYKYKIDPLTEEILPIIIDKHNHCWDALRYALQPVMKSSMFVGCDLS